MPYILATRKTNLDKNPMEVENVGELNYVFTRFFILLWNMYPKYATIHKLRLLSKHPEFDTELGLLCRRLSLETRPPMNRTDIETALDLAFLEFYRRVGQYYEDDKILENGDVYNDAIGATIEVKS